MVHQPQEFELLQPDVGFSAPEEGVVPSSRESTLVTRDELNSALRKVYGGFAVTILVCVVSVGTALTNGGHFSSPAFGRNEVTDLKAAQELWRGEDRVIVPYGFKGCDSANMPPQIAPARRAGNFLFMSGILGYKDPCVSAEPDPEKQIEAAFKWTQYIMNQTSTAAHKMSWKDVMSVTSYHVNIHEHVDVFTKMRNEYLPEEPYPAWTMVEVSGLYYENQVMELALIARTPPCNGMECDR